MLNAEEGLLKIRALGSAELVLNGIALHGKLQRKVVVLLAYLATESRPKSREHLMELFWPDADADAGAARSNLRGALYRLRRCLGDNAPLLVSRDSVGLDPARFQLDVSDFMKSLKAEAGCNELEEKLALYCGPLLEDISLDNCPDVEEWLAVKRETCHRHALGLALRLRDNYLQQRNMAKAIHFSRYFQQLNPWDEENLRQLMHLLAMYGYRDEALRQFETCRRSLHKEFGAEPEALTTALFEKIASGQLAGEQTPPSPGAPSSTPSATRSERHQVTALYCHIEFPQIIDPDERLERFVEMRQRCLSIIRRYGGYTSQPHGSAIFGYFGYPIAFEDATRRAVRAALALAELNDTEIRIRSGLHTGLTISSEQLPDEMGTNSLLALQIDSLDHPVTISETTYHLVEGYFRVESAAVLSSGDNGLSVKTYQVTGESGARTPLEAATRLTPFVGRTQESLLLLKHWRQVRKGRKGLTLLISGDAGIGKSRLLQTLKDTVQKQGGSIRELRCFPEYQQSPYYPLVKLLEALCDFSAADTAAEKALKLEACVREHFPAQGEHTFALLAQLLSLPVRSPIVLSAEQQKEAVHKLLLQLLHTLAARHPLLCIMEDLHWADPSTLALLKSHVEGANNIPLLMLLSARPSFTPPWKSASKTVLNLQPLNQEEVVQIISTINPDMPDEILRSIVLRADGIPLYVEEMAKITTHSNAAIPAKLHDLLAARLEHLGEAKQTALLAATMGREFDIDLLGKAASCTPATLTRNLRLLQQSGLVIPLSSTLQHFKHALIQEAIYQSQTRTDRQMIHRQIAQAMLDHFPDIVSGRPEHLARHLEESGQTEQAIYYWSNAGKLAAAQSANIEAMAHFNNALRLLEQLPYNTQRDNTEVEILGRLCPVLYAATGYGSAEATKANIRLSELGGASDSREFFLPKWAQVLNTICNTRGHKQDALAIALELPGMYPGDPVKEVATQYALGLSHFWLGQFEDARRHCEQAMSIYRPEFHSPLVEQFGDDLYVNAAAFSACAHCFLGYPKQAQIICARMIAHARSNPYPHSLAVALAWSAFIHRWLKLPQETLKSSAEIIELSQKHDFAVWLTVGESTHGWAQIMLGDSTGVTGLCSSIEKMKTILSGVPVLFKSPLVSAYLRLQQFDDALALVNEAMEDSIATGESFFDAELLRLKGECLMALGKREQAKKCFRQALSISQKQQAKLLELRIATSLATHFKDTSSLGTACSFFTGGFDAPDWERAGKLLEAGKEASDTNVSASN